MAENILNCGLDVSKEIKANLEELAASKLNAEAAKNAAAQGEKSVKAKDKAVKDEIANTLKKRKEEIEASFDTEVENLKQRTKEVKGEKGKDKGEQQAKRIEAETADFREKERELLLEIRSIFKRDGVPGIFNTKLYYALFLPRTIIEILVLILAIAITLVAIPSLITFFVLPANRSTFQVMLVYYACLFVFLGAYILIANLTKVKHRETYIEVLKIRREIRANKKTIKAVSKSVQRDKDESMYDLGHYDHEIERISDEVESILEKKKAALKEFEASTKQIITDQIMANNQAELDELKNFVEARNAEEKAASERAKELGIYIATNYEPYIGKTDLNVETMDRIISALENGKASTISEAITYIKQPVPEVVEEAPVVAEAEAAVQVEDNQQNIQNQ